MKKIKNKIVSSIMLVGVAAMLATTTVQAQDNTNFPAQNNFPQTAMAWLSSIDLTKSWPTNEMDISVGGLWQNNVNWANYINGQKNIGDFAFDGQMDNAGVAGTIYRIQGGLGYRLLNRGDTSATFLANGGYDRTIKSGFVEPQLLLRKLMAHGAFMEIGLNYDINLKGPLPNYPGVRVGTGFTF